MLLRLLVTSVLPLSISAVWRHQQDDALFIQERDDLRHLTIALSGAATATNAERAISVFRKALDTDKQIVIDVSRVSSVDPRFFGLFLMIRKQLAGRGMKLNITGAGPKVRRIFRLNRFGLLLSD